MDPNTWIDRYANAWRERDDVAVAALFTPDAVYRYSPTAAPRLGREEIRAHWRNATADFTELDLRFGPPLTQGERTVVEMWATLRDPAWHARRSGPVEPGGNDWITFPGCLVLRFTADGLCSHHQEYYNPVFGQRIDPPADWAR